MGAIGQGMSLKWRGDAASLDFTKASLTCDGNWHNLDLSGIVPVGTKAVTLSVWIMDDAVNSMIYFRKPGQSNDINSSTILTQANGAYMVEDITVFCDSNRNIEYMASNLVFTWISIAVMAWFI